MPCALLVPVLALLGFAAGGREVARLAEDPDWLNQAVAEIGFPDEDGVAVLYAIRNWFIGGFSPVLAAALIGRAVRRWITSHRAVVITYPDGQKVEMQTGTTILDASRIGGHSPRLRLRRPRPLLHLPGAHLRRRSASAAGERRRAQGAGPRRRRAQCAAGLPDAAHRRRRHRAAAAGHAPARATPRRGPAISRAMRRRSPSCSPTSAPSPAWPSTSCPMTWCSSSTAISAPWALAVENTGGRLDKFIGDGVMALFGIGANPGEGCRQALAAAKAMAENLQEINQTLQHDLNEPLRIGIGIHAGPAIVGEMGHGRATSITAIGDAVNTASRLEALTKEYGCQLIVSEAVAHHAGLDTAGCERHEIEIRGRREPLAIYAIADAHGLILPSSPQSDGKKRGRRRLIGVRTEERAMSNLRATP